MKERIQYFATKFKSLLIVLVMVLLLENVLLAYNNVQNRFPILGLKFNNQFLLGKNRSDLEYLVQHQFNPGKPLKLVYGNQTISVTPSDIGGSVNPTLITNELLQEGKTGNIFERLATQNKALLGLDNKQLVGTLSPSLLTIKLLDISDTINQDAVPIMPNFMDNYSKTVPAQDGIRVDTDKLSLLIAKNIFNPPDASITIPTVKTTTHHLESELVPIRREIPSLVKNPITISSGGQTLALSTEDILSLLTVKERPDPKNPKQLMLVLRLDDKKLNQKLGDFASQVQNKTQAEFDEYDARIAIYSEFLSPDNRSIVTIPTGGRLNVLGLQTTNGPKVAYLTFDDGTNSLYHPMILDILKQYNIKATFFLIGSNAQRSPDITLRTIAEGHVVGDHTLTHQFLPSLSPSGIRTELLGAKNVLTTFYNQPITLFRPPYGGTNKTVAQISTQLGMKQVLWDVDPQDWTEPSVSILVSRVVDRTYPGAIILMHSNHITTVKALPNIIQTLQSKGYSFQTLQ